MDVMENFIFGLQNIAYNISNTIFAIMRQHLVWGFAIGFGISTMVHLFLMTENPRHIPTILFHKQAKSFSQLAPRDANGSFQISYTQFQAEYNKTKTLFYLTLCAFLGVVIIALLRY